MSRRLFTFAGGSSGLWRVVGMQCLLGEPLARVERLDVISGGVPQSEDTPWTLQGITSNERYVTREEKQSLVSKQEGRGRSEATCAALIPIRKNPAWWV